MIRAYNNDNHKRLMNEFYEFLRIFNDVFNVSIVLIGKLGIQEFFNVFINAKCIEVLIPESISKKELQFVLSSKGYEMLDCKTFLKNGFKFVYSSLNKCLEKFEIENLNDTGKIINKDWPVELEDNPVLLNEWMNNSNGYYLFNKKMLKKIYQDDLEIIEILNKIAVDS